MLVLQASGPMFGSLTKFDEYSCLSLYKNKKYLENYLSQAVVAHAFNPSTWEAEADGSLWVRGQPGLQELIPGLAPKQHRETLSQKARKKRYCLIFC